MRLSLATCPKERLTKSPQISLPLIGWTQSCEAMGGGVDGDWSMDGDVAAYILHVGIEGAIRPIMVMDDGIGESVLFRADSDKFYIWDPFECSIHGISQLLIPTISSPFLKLFGTNSEG